MTYLIIPAGMDKRLATLAEKAHMQKDQYTLQALEEYLEDQEDYLVALARMERLESGEDKAISFEEIVKQYIQKHESKDMEH
jgi:RHH-type rel operon transcriptional repressor/antitoxin RelB